MYNKKTIQIGNKTFPSIKEAAKHYKIPISHVYLRRNLNWTMEQALELEPAPNSININGIQFNSIVSLCNAYNINEKTFHTRIKRKWTLKQAIGIDPPPKTARSAYNIYLLQYNKRLCLKCDQEKDLTEFYFVKTKNTWSANCKSCANIQSSNSARIRKYGLDNEAWEALFKKQNNKCIICNVNKTKNKRWHTDHCHKTNIIRGILCQNCNLMLGNAQDNTQILQKAIDYLNSYVDLEEAS